MADASVEDADALATTMVTGRLHCVLAFDWGDAIDLERALDLVPAETKEFPRRRRTPETIAYRPSPLRFHLGSKWLPLPDLTAPAEIEALVFDFAAVNVAFRVPFALSAAQLRDLAIALAEPKWLLPAAREAVEALYRQLLPAIEAPGWSDLHEEYFTFQLDPQPAFFRDSQLAAAYAPWIVSLLRLDDTPLADQELSEALRCQLSYGREDLVLIDSLAGVVIDTDCEETLHTIEFANLQLLEYRFLDRKLEDALTTARKQIDVATRSRLPFWRTHARPLRLLSEIRMDAVGTLERASGALHLVGDQYLARVYRLLSDRFHLPTWADNVRRALDVAESVHQTLSSQSAMYRLELLELTVVLLILIEIVLAMTVKH